MRLRFKIVEWLILKLSVYELGRLFFIWQRTQEKKFSGDSTKKFRDDITAEVVTSETPLKFTIPTLSCPCCGEKLTEERMKTIKKDSRFFSCGLWR